MSTSYHRNSFRFGYTHTVRVKGEVLKNVKCRNCGCEFAYKLERTGFGNGIEWPWNECENVIEVATRKAKAELSELLKGEIDAVPCPDCSAVQEEMLELPGSDLWLKALYFVSGCAALFLALSQITATTNALAMTGATGLTVVAFFLTQYRKGAGSPKIIRRKRRRGRPRV